MSLHRRQSLNERIQSLASLREVEGYLLGIAMTKREVLDLEATLLERRIDNLSPHRSAGERAGSPSRPSLDPRVLKAKLAALRASHAAGGNHA